MKILTIDDLKTLNFDELLELRSNVEKTIQAYQKDREKEITQKFIADMQAIGISIESLKELKFSSVKKTNKKTAKYRNPNDNTQTWSGFGPHPDWVKAHINNGGSKSDLLM
jgi:DNA-binding protein H-NS